MDLLSQYRQDHPEAFQEQKPLPLTDEYGRTYSGMIALVMRLSGGRIKDAKTASYALLGLVGFIILISMASFWIFNGSAGENLQNRFPSGYPAVR